MTMTAGAIAISTLLASVAPAAGPKTLPKLYRVDGRPVPVSCLEHLISPEDQTRKMPIDLRTCGNTELRPKVQTDGSVGYDTTDGGYFYYFYVCQSGGMDILSLQNSGGGSGRFTQLVGVKHSGYLVSWVKDIAGGDRCNGGISGEKISKGKLVFDQAITPYDLIELAHPKEQLNAYHDLEDSAASCIGVAHRNGYGMWTGVAFTKTHWADQSGWTEKYKYQACFNKLYRDTVLGRQRELSREGVMKFADAFTTNCVRSQSASPSAAH